MRETKNLFNMNALFVTAFFILQLGRNQGQEITIPTSSLYNQTMPMSQSQTSIHPTRSSRIPTMSSSVMPTRENRTTTTFPPVQNAFECNFENGACLPKSVGFWKRSTGPTPTEGTGPTTDSQGRPSGIRYYMYYAQPVPVIRGNPSSIVYRITLSSSYCVEFDYHMYSSDNTMGTLEVRIASLGGSSVGDLRITGNQGNIWHRAKFQVSNVLSISGYTNLIFTAIGGNTIRSDMAIDDIVVTKGQCRGPTSPPVITSISTRVQPSSSSIVPHSSFILSSSMSLVSTQKVSQSMKSSSMSMNQSQSMTMSQSVSSSMPISQSQTSIQPTISSIMPTSSSSIVPTTANRTTIVLPTNPPRTTPRTTTTIFKTPSTRSGFIPFGTSFGDRNVANGDDTADCFGVSNNFPLFVKKNRKQICISSNGYLTVDQRISSTSVTLNNLGYPIIIPYNVDMNNRGRHIFYRTAKDSYTLGFVDKDISLALGQAGNPLRFNATEAIIVTYNDIPRYGSTSNRFKYQVVIATDYTNTFTILNYDRLDINGNDNVGYSDTGQCRVTKRFTSSSNKRTLTITSNVGRPGKHIHLLSRKTTDDCINKGVLYPYGRNASDVIKITTFRNRYLVPLQSDWPLFSKAGEQLMIFTEGYIGRGATNFNPSSFYRRSVTWISPFYSTFRGLLTISYRETNESSLLQQVTSDIQRNSSQNFNATNLFIVTYASVGSKFQVALATDGHETFAVFNYAELQAEPNRGSVEMNEPGCGYKQFFERSGSLQKLLKGNSTGVRGRHVFNLTTVNCFTKVNGLRVNRGARTSIFNLFNSFRRNLPPVLQLNEIGSVLFHLKEAVNFQGGPVTVIVERNSGVTQNNYFSRYGTFNSERFAVVGFNNLFVLRNTTKSPSFQYAELRFGEVASQTRCQKFYFEEKMDSTPSIKITAAVDSANLRNYVNVWLKNVSSSSFTVCAKEMIAFSGKRSISVYYVAATSKSNLVEESTHFEHETNINNITDSCVERNFKNEYLSIPHVFTSIESVGRARSEDLDMEEPVLMWVKGVTKTKMTVCVRPLKKGNYRIHLIAKGKISPCNQFSCPSHLECGLTSKAQPYCGCIQNCARYNDKKVFCGSNFKTYQSVCRMNQEHCEKFGNSTKINVTIGHYGECQVNPIQSGVTQLNVVPEMQGVFCKYINLQSENFIETKSSPLKVLLSVSWGQKHFTKPNDASASWSEDVSVNGFKACVLVAGRHLDSDFKSPPSVHWMVFQEEMFDGNLYIGSQTFTLDTWYTGTQCKRARIFQAGVGALKVYASVEHSKRRNYQNAMTVWSEITPIHFNRLDVRICARELQNFDGIHKDIKIHYMIVRGALKSPSTPFIPEQMEITFPSKTIPLGAENPVECKTTVYNTQFPSLSNPTVLVGGINTASNQQQISTSSKTSIYSQHDIAVWIEHTGTAEITVCMKSLRNTISRPGLVVGVLVVANLCQDGGHYYRGSCYKKISQCQPFNLANAQCLIAGASLPVISSEEEALFIQERIQTATWLNLAKTSSSQWYWQSGEPLNFTKWFPGQPSELPDHSCAVVDNRGINSGWKAEHCSACRTTVCEKDARLSERSCQSLCLNGGTCMVSSTTSVTCTCPAGFSGERCHIDVSKIEGCFNYTMQNDGWRNIINSSNSTIQSNETSCDARYLREGWHRFTGAAGTKLYSRCPNSGNRCGTRSPGWIADSKYPTVLGESQRMKLHYHSFYCADDFGSVLVKNCGGFFTYKFDKIPYWSCNFGICTV